MLYFETPPRKNSKTPPSYGRTIDLDLSESGQLNLYACHGQDLKFTTPSFSSMSIIS